VADSSENSNEFLVPKYVRDYFTGFLKKILVHGIHHIKARTYLTSKAPVYEILVPYRLDVINPLKPELNPICYLLALLGAHRFLHVSRIRAKLLIFRLLMSYIYGAPILDVSRSHTTTQHSR